MSGEDDLGDIHSFRTEDRKRADEMRRIMTGKLKRVEMIEILYRYRRPDMAVPDILHPDFDAS